MEVVMTTGAISRAKLQSNHHHQQTNIQFFYRPDALPVAQPTVSKHWREKQVITGLKKKRSHIPWTCLPPSSNGVFQLCLWPLIAPGYLGGGLPCLSSALWCQYPRKTPLMNPTRVEGIISTKPGPKSVYDFLGVVYCFVVLFCVCLVLRPYILLWHVIACLCLKFR